jgi:methylmalonyl-CoA mutase N-terminal domain/subunit
MRREIDKSAYQFQKEVENGERMIIGVNCFTDASEIEVLPKRVLPHPYEEKRLASAQKRQIGSLKKIKKERDNAKVNLCLKRLKDAAMDDGVNMIPVILEAVKAYASVGEMCNVLREVWGEYSSFSR